MLSMQMMFELSTKFAWNVNSAWWKLSWQPLVWTYGHNHFSNVGDYQIRSGELLIIWLWSLFNAVVYLMHQCKGPKVKSAWWSLQKDLALPLLPICIKKGTEVESSFFFRSKHSGQKMSNEKNWSFENVNQKLVLHQWVWNRICSEWFQEVIKIKLITRSLLRAEIISNNSSAQVQILENFDSFPNYFEL